MRRSTTAPITLAIPSFLAFQRYAPLRAGLGRRVLAFADTNCDGTEAPMASDPSIRLRRDPKRIASRHRGNQSGWVLRVGDPVEVFDTDGWGPEGVWLRGTVFQLLPRGR